MLRYTLHFTNKTIQVSILGWGLYSNSISQSMRICLYLWMNVLLFFSSLVTWCCTGQKLFSIVSFLIWPQDKVHFPLRICVNCTMKWQTWVDVMKAHSNNKWPITFKPPVKHKKTKYHYTLLLTVPLRPPQLQIFKPALQNKTCVTPISHQANQEQSSGTNDRMMNILYDFYSGSHKTVQRTKHY